MRWRGDNNHWGAIAIAFHWLVAVVVIEQFILGSWMTELDYFNRWYHEAPDIHKSIGSLLFIVLFARLAWRLYNHRPVELATHKPWERVLAKWVQYAIYFLLFAVIISGYLIATADGRGIDVFGWFTIPATLHDLDHQEDIAGAIHAFFAGTLIGLASLHAAAALKHHFIDRDSTLRRMLGL